MGRRAQAGWLGKANGRQTVIWGERLEHGMAELGLAVGRVRRKLEKAPLADWAVRVQ